jgi:hypothetical protein
MFADPFAAVMVLVILSFTGMLLMFVFGLRTFDVLQKTLNELKAQLSVDAADLDQRLREIEDALRKIESSRPAETDDDLGRLLEKAAANKTAGAWMPPAAARPATTPLILDSLPPGAEAPAEGGQETPWAPEHPLSLK